VSRAASLADRAFPEGAQRVDAAMPVKVRELSVRHPHRPAIGRLTWVCRRIERFTGYRATWPDPLTRFWKQDSYIESSGLFVWLWLVVNDRKFLVFFSNINQSAVLLHEPVTKRISQPNELKTDIGTAAWIYSVLRKPNMHESGRKIFLSVCFL